jgi:DNA-directed RNA polymerase specialized sigma24 family protein
MTQLTELIRRLHAGDDSARDALFSAAYAELHRLAQSRLRDRGRHLTLDTTSLVHETYLRFMHAVGTRNKPGGATVSLSQCRDRLSIPRTLEGTAMQFVVWVETMIAGQSVAVQRAAVVERQCLANVPTKLGLTLQDGRAILNACIRSTMHRNEAWRL